MHFLIYRHAIKSGRKTYLTKQGGLTRQQYKAAVFTTVQEAERFVEVCEPLQRYGAEWSIGEKKSIKRQLTLSGTLITRTDNKGATL